MITRGAHSADPPIAETSLQERSHRGFSLSTQRQAQCDGGVRFETKRTFAFPLPGLNFFCKVRTGFGGVVLNSWPDFWACVPHDPFFSFPDEDQMI